eukprot:gnl/Chilomastix_cuspidata/2415.p1 GENE.gnl/Chilomastix_cuspidata/2415~~gnl/Chilomastix_cuspidata/2415.p1  ORF type:complete len:543 (+),score=223.06 gnl/Chilomastix_cuspidata/2415:479-2107(+)
MNAAVAEQRARTHEAEQSTLELGALIPKLSLSVAALLDLVHAACARIGEQHRRCSRALLYAVDLESAFGAFEDFAHTLPGGDAFAPQLNREGRFTASEFHTDFTRLLRGGGALQPGESVVDALLRDWRATEPQRILDAARSVPDRVSRLTSAADGTVSATQISDVVFQLVRQFKPTGGAVLAPHPRHAPLNEPLTALVALQAHAQRIARAREDARRKADKLTGEVSSLTSRTSALEAEKRDAEAQLSALRTQLAAQAPLDRVRELELQLTAEKTRVTRLVADLSDAHRQLSETRAQALSFERENSKLAAKRDAQKQLKTRRDQLQEELHRVRAAAAHKEEQLSADARAHSEKLNAELERAAALKSELARAQQTIVELRGSASRVRKDDAEERAVWTEFARNHAFLKRELESAYGKIRSLSEAGRRTAEDNERLVAELRRTRSVLVLEQENLMNEKQARHLIAKNRLSFLERRSVVEHEIANSLSKTVPGRRGATPGPTLAAPLRMLSIHTPSPAAISQAAAYLSEQEIAALHESLTEPGALE